MMLGRVGGSAASPLDNHPEIFKRLKIGLSLLVGFALGKLAAAWSPAHYSALFSVGFLAGAVGAQGLFRLFELGRRKPR